MLGKGRVQREVISELKGLSDESQISSSTLELVDNLLTRLKVSEELESPPAKPGFLEKPGFWDTKKRGFWQYLTGSLDEEDRELIMELSPIYRQRL